MSRRLHEETRSPAWGHSYERYGWSAHHAADRYRPPPEEIRISRTSSYRKSISPQPRRSYTPVNVKKSHHTHRRKSRSPRYQSPSPEWISPGRPSRRYSRSPVYRSRSPIQRAYTSPQLTRRSRSPVSHRKLRLSPQERPKLSPKRHVSRKKSRSPSYEKAPLKKHLKQRSPVASESSNSFDEIQPEESTSRHSYSAKISNKSEKKRHPVKMKKSQKRPHSKSHKKKKKKKKMRSVTSSPVPVNSPTSPPTPSPSASTSSKKMRSISSNMNDTSLFAQLVRGKHFKNKKEEEEDINGVAKCEKNDEISVANQDTDSSK